MIIEKNLVNVGMRDDRTQMYRLYGTCKFGAGYFVSMDQLEQALREFVEEGFLIKSVNLCLTHNNVGEEVLELRAQREPTMAEIEEYEARQREVRVERTLRQMQQLRGLLHKYPQLAKMSEAWATSEDIDVAESLIAP